MVYFYLKMLNINENEWTITAHSNMGESHSQYWAKEPKVHTMWLQTTVTYNARS